MSIKNFKFIGVKGIYTFTDKSGDNYGDLRIPRKYLTEEFNDYIKAKTKFIKRDLKKREAMGVKEDKEGFVKSNEEENMEIRLANSPR